MSVGLSARARSLLRNILRRGEVERSLDAEVQACLDLLTDEKIAAGMAAEAARRAARVELGGPEQLKERVREVRTGAWLTELAQDGRYAIRMMRRSPSFTFVTLATLALGIGANAAMFGIVNAVLLRPLPYARPDRLVSISGIGYIGEMLELRDAARSLEATGYAPDRPVTLTGAGDPVRLAAASIDADLTRLFGVVPVLGREFRASDERTGAAPVVLIGTPMWRERFGGNPGIVGTTLRIDGVNRTIVGVMPRRLQFPSRETALWLPLRVDDADRVALWSTGVHLLGRIRAGYSLDQVRAELRGIGPTMRAKFPWNMPADYGRAVTAIPLREAMVGAVNGLLLILFGSVGLVLLIASINVGNLFVARAVGRQRELAIRCAIGAGRSRVLRQLLTEGTVFGLAGGACGLAVAFLLLHAAGRLLPAGMPRAAEIALDAPVLAFAAAVALACGALVGTLPALAASRGEAAPALRGGLRTGAPRRTAFTSSALVAAQLAIAVPLVIAAVLLGRSFWNLTRLTPGFPPARLVAARVAPPAFRFRDAPALGAFYAQLRDRARSLPGRERVALASLAPFGPDLFGSVFLIAGRPDPVRGTGEWPVADIRAAIDPDYLPTVGIAVGDGRNFTPADTMGARRVALVSRGLASRYWPGESAVGRQIRFPADTTWRTIVGVTADVKWSGLAEDAGTALYVPLAQAPSPSVTILVRTPAAPSRVAADLRALVASLDRDTSVDDVRTMEARIGASLWTPRFATFLISAFAALALSLGALGVYGAMSDLVARSRRDIAVRIALGAGLTHVIRDIVVRALAPAAAGILIGVASAAAATRLLTALLFGVAPIDASTFILVPVALAIVAVGASLVPARRAARIDPLAALRSE